MELTMAQTFVCVGTDRDMSIENPAYQGTDHGMLDLVLTRQGTDDDMMEQMMPCQGTDHAKQKFGDE